jgi:hypothetical protein
VSLFADRREPASINTLESLRLLIEANDRRLSDLMAERDLRYHERHKASRDAVNMALETSKDAITKAETAYEKRFDSNNEWKETFSELSGRMVTRTEYSTAHEAMKDKIEEVGGRVKTIEGKSSGIGASLGVVMGVAALMISLAFGAINFMRSTPEMIHPPVLQAPR